MAFPASSTAVERVFSAAGNVQYEHHGSLSLRMLAKQACCSVWRQNDIDTETNVLTIVECSICSHFGTLAK